VGRIQVRRAYFRCPRCGQGEFATDRVLGLQGYLTSAAQRLASLAGVQQSFGQAEHLLRELAGWQLDEETIRRLCHQVAARASATRAERATAERFAAASGDLELQIDAGKVNTLQGWRDVKVAVFARRQRGEPAAAQHWDQRKLPAPSVRSVLAAVEEAERFGERCATEAQRLNLTEPSALHVLADGGEWIWNLVSQRFAGAGQTLDIYHGVEYIAEAARTVFGAGQPEAKVQSDAGILRLLEDGYWGVVAWVGEISGQLPVGGDGAALRVALNYFAGQQARLGYALRLRRGQSIGSGMVEGSIKQLLNRRLKQTGARWKTAHVGPFVELKALANGPEWNAYWN
jgi:hypothetical protein